MAPFTVLGWLQLLVCCSICFLVVFFSLLLTLSTRFIHSIGNIPYNIHASGLNSAFRAHAHTYTLAHCFFYVT